MTKKNILLVAILTFAFSPFAEARPVSYPGGWTVMTMNDADSNSSHIHYTPDPTYSVGWRHEYLRNTKSNADFVQMNNLLKRWNAKASQANIYLKSGVGIAYDSDRIEPAAFTGIAGDWEDRRYFISYENRFFYGGNIDKFAKHSARVGITPYIGDYGDVHTWLMLQTDYDAGQDDNFSLTPLVRFFYGADLLEAGYNLDDGMMFNYVHRF